MQGVPVSCRGSSLPALCSLQTDKEQLSAEAKELRQKVKCLHEQLSPLTRQRDYQEKEIQRLNKVGTLVLVPRASRASLSPTPTSAQPSVQEGQVWVRAPVLRAWVPPEVPASAFSSPHAAGPALGRARACSPPCPWTCCFLTHATLLIVQVQRGLPQISFRLPCFTHLESQQLLSRPFSHFLVITYLTFCLLMQWWKVRVFTGTYTPSVWHKAHAQGILADGSE